MDTSDVDLPGSRLGSDQLIPVLAFRPRLPHSRPVALPGKRPFAATVLLLFASAALPAAAQVAPIRIQSRDVQITGPRRLAATLPQLRRYRTQLVHCYEQSLQRDPTLAGRVALRFTIGADGRVTAAEIVESTIVPAVGDCLAARARTWSFPADPRGVESVVVLQVRFAVRPRPLGLHHFATRPGGAPAIPPQLVRAVDSEVRVEGEIDPLLVRRVVAQRLIAIRRCYETALRPHPDLAGRLVVRFVVQASGAVSEAAVEESSLGKPELESCVVFRFRHLRLPPSPGPGPFIVHYPLLFRPDGG